MPIEAEELISLNSKDNHFIYIEALRAGKKAVLSE
jgi:hypothetical protein